MDEPRPPRSQDQLFADLRALAQEQGALHEVSGIVYRDWVLTIDLKEARVTDDPQQRWSTDKLNTNELLLLVGLMVQAPDDRTYATEVQGTEFAARADALFREFHDRLNEDARAVFDLTSRTFLEKPDSLGMFAREAIYYGAQSFYLHQFAHFARHRYRDDATWLLQNAGISVRPMIEIANFIVEAVTAQMTSVRRLQAEGKALSNSELTNSLLVPAEALRKRVGSKANAFIAKFATPPYSANGGFDNAFAINRVMIAPLINIGEFLYTPNQYRLLESIYESPFYWMIVDDAYKARASTNRGVFLEKTAAHILRNVFGSDNVWVNARLPVADNQIGGEIDVLVRYGEFVIAVQAKSKRITLKARAGDPEALKTDFKGAIQDPYAQALASCELIKNGAACVDRDGKSIDLPGFPRLFPLVVLSDPFPAATSLSHRLLDRPENAPAPVIWDIGVLDCVARMLPKPIEMLFYLKSRGDVFNTAISDSEYNYLGYHIQAKLALPENTFVVIDRDFATTVDDFMIAADLKLDAPPPKGVLETLDIPLVSPLLADLKSAPPEIAAVVIDLYDFSGAALKEVSQTILKLREEVAKERKPIKAFSLVTASGGLTYAVALDLSRKSYEAAAAIGRKNKYEAKADRWHVILDTIATEQPIDGLLPLVWPWVENEEEGAAVKRAGTMFSSTRPEVVIGKGDTT
jgi:hypothetical protein